MTHGFRPIGRRRAVLTAALLAFGCASAPAPDPDSTVVWGYVRLVPKAGSQSSGGGYGDRRVADVKRVDYSQTKFAVVFAPNTPSESRSAAELVIRSTDDGARLEPHFASTSPAAGIRILNSTPSPQIVSVPDAARLERIAPGESVLVDGVASGELSVHLLGTHETDAPEPSQVWVTEGRTAIVDSSGRYTLRGLEPGPHLIRAWHPRLPPSPAHSVALERGSVVRLDVEIGLDAEAPQAQEAR